MSFFIIFSGRTYYLHTDIGYDGKIHIFALFVIASI